MDAGPSDIRMAKQADKPDSVHTGRPKARGAWQPFL